jgi:hypothetical protein
MEYLWSTYGVPYVLERIYERRVKRNICIWTGPDCDEMSKVENEAGGCTYRGLGHSICPHRTTPQVLIGRKVTSLVLQNTNEIHSGR